MHSQVVMNRAIQIVISFQIVNIKAACHNSNYSLDQDIDELRIIKSPMRDLHSSFANNPAAILFINCA